MSRMMWALLAVALLTLAVAARAQTGGGCDRACLIALTEAYLSAMVARDPARAPVTANVRFTQNTRPMALGQGLWESITGVRAYKLFVTDPLAGQVALDAIGWRSAHPPTGRRRAEPARDPRLKSENLAGGTGNAENPEVLVPSVPAVPDLDAVRLAGAPARGAALVG